MKFFIPGLETEADAEAVYEAIRKFSSEQTGATLSGGRIFSLSGIYDGAYFTATVGIPFQGETVIAILFAAVRRCYFICTLNRGALRGMPFLLAENEVQSVDFFEL